MFRVASYGLRVPSCLGYLSYLGSLSSSYVKSYGLRVASYALLSSSSSLFWLLALNLRPTTLNLNSVTSDNSCGSNLSNNSSSNSMPSPLSGLKQLL
jgi:hypothetical protein